MNINWNARYRKHLTLMQMAARFVRRDQEAQHRHGLTDKVSIGIDAAMFNHHAKWVNALSSDWYIMLDGQDYPHAWGSKLSKTWAYWSRAQQAANLNKTTARLHMPGGAGNGLYATCNPQPAKSADDQANAKRLELLALQEAEEAELFDKYGEVRYSID